MGIYTLFHHLCVILSIWFGAQMNAKVSPKTFYPCGVVPKMDAKTIWFGELGRRVWGLGVGTHWVPGPWGRPSPTSGKGALGPMGPHPPTPTPPPELPTPNVVARNTPSWYNMMLS